MHRVSIRGVSDAISQQAQQIGPFQWTEGDPVSLAWKVDVDWSGDYICQVRKTRKPSADLICELDVTATYDIMTELTTFTMTMTEADSAEVTKGKYYCDVQQENGVTRVWGVVNVGAQVTVAP